MLRPEGPSACVCVSLPLLPQVISPPSDKQLFFLYSSAVADKDGRRSCWSLLVCVCFAAVLSSQCRRVFGLFFVALSVVVVCSSPCLAVADAGGVLTSLSGPVCLAFDQHQFVLLTVCLFFLDFPFTQLGVCRSSSPLWSGVSWTAE